MLGTNMQKQKSSADYRLQSKRRRMKIALPFMFKTEIEWKLKLPVISRSHQSFSTIFFPSQILF